MIFVPQQNLVVLHECSYKEAELEQWVADHPEYSASQLRAVVQVITWHSVDDRAAFQGVTNSNSSNKTKQKLNSLINDLSFKIRR